MPRGRKKGSKNKTQKNKHIDRKVRCPFCKTTKTTLGIANEHNVVQGSCDICDETFYFIRHNVRVTYYHDSTGLEILKASHISKEEFQPKDKEKVTSGWNIRHRISRDRVETDEVELDMALDICREQYPDLVWTRETTWGTPPGVVVNELKPISLDEIGD